MNEITVGNYRCFRGRQTVRLAPLTLLVGNNSTGKTSFLAMIKALMDVAIEFRMPDFKEEPFDLGSFEEIAHHRGGRCGHTATFEGGYGVSLQKDFNDSGSVAPYHFEVEFGREGSAPIPIRRRIQHGDTWWEHRFSDNRAHRFFIGNARGLWEIKLPNSIPGLADWGEYQVVSPYWVLGVLFTGVLPWVNALEPVGDMDPVLNTEEIGAPCPPVGAPCPAAAGRVFQEVQTARSSLGGTAFCECAGPLKASPNL